MDTEGGQERAQGEAAKAENMVAVVSTEVRLFHTNVGTASSSLAGSSFSPPPRKAIPDSHPPNRLFSHPIIFITLTTSATLPPPLDTHKCNTTLIIPAHCRHRSYKKLGCKKLQRHAVLTW